MAEGVPLAAVQLVEAGRFVTDCSRKAGPAVGHETTTFVLERVMLRGGWAPLQLFQLAFRTNGTRPPGSPALLEPEGMPLFQEIDAAGLSPATAPRDSNMKSDFAQILIRKGFSDGSSSCLR